LPVKFIPTFILISVLGCTVVFSQQTLSQVQREMARVEKEIKREKKLHKLEKKKAIEFEKRKKKKLAALNKQLVDLDGKKAGIKKRVSQLKGQKFSYKKQIKNLEIKRKKVSEHLIKKIDELILFFEKDFPHRLKNRIRQLKNLQQEIKEGVASPEMGMNRLFTFLKSAIDLGYEAEAFSGSYKATDGKTYQGKYLRMGTVISAFVSLDGNKVGYQVLDDKGYTWVDENLELTLKQNIKFAIQVVEGKAAPELVYLPFLVPVEKAGTP